MFWMGFEKTSTVIGALFITIYTAKHLGPEKMGMFYFALAVVTIILPVSQLGSDTIIFNRVAKKRYSGVRLLIYSQILRTYVYIGLSILLLAVCIHYDYSNTEIVIIGLMLVSSYFSSQDVYKIYFDATLNSKINTLSSQIGLVASSIVRVALVMFNANLFMFTLPYILNTAIPFFIRKERFINVKKEVAINSSSVDVNNERAIYRSYLIKNGYPLVISGISIALYTRVGQIMLGNLEGTSMVGYYNAALTIAGGWSFVPIVCMTSLLPVVLKDRNSKNMGFSFIYLVALLVSVPLVLLCETFDYEMIYYTYGEEFIPSVEVFSILAVSTLFSVLGVIASRVIIANYGNGYLMKKMCLMAVLNMLLTYFLIAKYGLVGAAYAILITEIISSTVANYFFKKGHILRIHLLILSSFIYVQYLLNNTNKKECK